LDRASFYAEATNALWHRRLKGNNRLYDLAEARDTALAAVAGMIGVDALEANSGTLLRAGVVGDLREALRQSDLLHFDDERLCASFPHLTFQEFHLARFWLAHDLTQVLEANWADPRCEEALALLVALHWGTGRSADVERALLAFTKGWRTRHRRDPSQLWSMGRSPYVVALTLLGRAGVQPSDPLLGADRQTAIRLNIANRPDLPLATVARLAEGTDQGGRDDMARRSWTPPEILARLVEDYPTGHIPYLVADNISTPSTVLDQLAEDPRPGVRAKVAWNTSASPETLARLAEDTDPNVRWGALRNRSIPPKALARRVSDPDAYSAATAGCSITQAEVLAHLAEDPDRGVRFMASQNSATPPEVLAQLAEDTDRGVRANVAGNTSTPPEIVARLAEDFDDSVRSASVRNGATRPEALARLAGDSWQHIRIGVAENHLTPPEALARLAEDLKAHVRKSVARNKSTPPEALARLAEDFERPDVEELPIRQTVCWNPSTPPEILARMANDSDAIVRREVAGNPSLPLTAIVQLADDLTFIRRIIAGNISTPPVILAFMADDLSSDVRTAIAKNVASLPEDLWVRSRFSPTWRVIRSVMRLATRGYWNSIWKP
jgi:hypothetical protein